MPQDRDSGAAAATYGHRMGQAVCRLLGATKLSKGSNEVVWRGQRGVIKSCRIKTSSFGITTSMVQRLDIALVAIEQPGGAYAVIEVPITHFKRAMRDSMSGRADGSVQLMGRVEAELYGRVVAMFTAREIAEAGG